MWSMRLPRFLCLATGSRLPRTELFEAAVREHNGSQLKSDQIRGDLKSSLRNILRAPDEFRDVLKKHYDKFRHEKSAVSLQVLGDSCWCPSQNKMASAENAHPCASVSEEACVLWLKRTILNFEKKVNPAASVKAKVLPP